MSIPPSGRPIRPPWLSPILAAALLACLHAPAVRAEAQDDPPPALRASVRFVTPAPSEVAFGPTLVRVSVSPPPGTVVRSVKIFLDGELTAVDLIPPFTMQFDAGSDMASHTIRAVAAFSDGTAASNAIMTRGLDLTEHEIVEGEPIEPMSLLVSVIDGDGMPVKGLTREDFRVRDRGDIVEIKEFGTFSDQKSLPLSITVLVDRSGSMGVDEESWREASLALVKTLRPIDQVRISAFASQCEVLQDFTRDAASLAESVRKLRPPEGATRLYASVYETVRDMRDFPGRKAVFILTDGADSEFGIFSGGSRGSRRTAILGAIERLAVRSGVTLVTILTTPARDQMIPIQALAVRTGGWWSPPTRDLAGLMTRLGERLLGAYVLGYEVSDLKAPDHKRRTRVTIMRENPGWRVFTASGTYGHQPVMSVLKDDLQAGSAAQRRRAVRELQRLGADDAAPLLVRALDDPSPEVRTAALEALGSIRDLETLEEILKLCRDDEPVVREAAFQATVRFGREALPGLTRLAARRTRDRGAALRALGLIGDPQALPLLRQGLEDPQCAIRGAAADGTGFLFELAGGGFSTEEEASDESREALALLEQALEDECAEVADAAALALGRLAHPAALPRLISIATGTVETVHQEESMLALASYLSPGTLVALERRLVAGPVISPESRETTAALYGAAIRTVRWLGTADGRARLTDLGVEEARQVLAELQSLGRALGAAPEWMEPIEALLSDLEEQALQGVAPAEPPPD